MGKRFRDRFRNENAKRLCDKMPFGNLLTMEKSTERFAKKRMGRLQCFQKR